MEIASTGLFVIGLLIAIAGWVMVVIAAFRAGVGWGIGSLLIPLVALIFVITHWEDSRRGFFTQLGGTAIVILGVLIAPAKKPLEAKPEAAAQTQTTPAAANAEYTPPPQPPMPQPQPKKYVPPPVEEPPQPAITKVYADNTTHLYYAADCARHPENALLISKTAATMQGYKPADCK